MSTLAELRMFVIQRDRQCLAAALDLTHECRDAWGSPHAPTDLSKLTLEHVKTLRTRRRVDHPHHCVAMCSQGNVTEHWSDGTDNNRLANAYLLGIATMDGGMV